MSRSSTAQHQSLDQDAVSYITQEVTHVCDDESHHALLQQHTMRKAHALFCNKRIMPTVDMPLLDRRL